MASLIIYARPNVDGTWGQNLSLHTSDMQYYMEQGLSCNKLEVPDVTPHRLSNLLCRIIRHNAGRPLDVSGTTFPSQAEANMSMQLAISQYLDGVRY